MNTLLADLDQLVRQTYSLWDASWVTFNWRAYTYDHVQRVRGLALTLGRREDCDEHVTELAALLHDVTKPYDGEYLTDEQGRRIVDERGYWRNKTRPPRRLGEVTRLYERLELAGTLHNESGGIIARHLLHSRGVDEKTCASVARAIQEHLCPPNDAGVESRCLYDADTIDANIGLPAFVRNIHINQHFYDLRRPPETPALAEVLADDPLAFLRPYVQQKLPSWVRGKQRDFVPRLLTTAGRDLALQRLHRLEGAIATMERELDAFGQNGHRSSLGLILHYMRANQDPSMAEETAYLGAHWRPPQTPPASLALIRDIQREMRGEI